MVAGVVVKGRCSGKSSAGGHSVPESSMGLNYDAELAHFQRLLQHISPTIVWSTFPAFIYVCICVFLYFIIYLFLSSLPSWTSWPNERKGLDIGRRPLHISFPCSSGKVLDKLWDETEGESGVRVICKIPYFAELDYSYLLLLMFCVCMLGHCKSFSL